MAVTTIDGVNKIQIRNAKNGDFDLNLAGGGGGSSEEDYEIEIDMDVPSGGAPQLTVLKHPSEQFSAPKKAKINFKYAEEIPLEDKSYIFDVFNFFYQDIAGPSCVIPMHNEFGEDMMIIMSGEYLETATLNSDSYIEVSTVESKTIQSESVTFIACSVSIIVNGTTHHPSELRNLGLVDTKHMVNRYPSFRFAFTDRMETLLAVNVFEDELVVNTNTPVYRLSNLY